MSAPNIDFDTELSAVNSILGAIGQAPVTKLAETEETTITQDNNQVTVPQLQFVDPQVAFVYQLLQEANLDTQLHGWVFNTESWFSLNPQTINGQQQFVFPDNILRWDVS